MKTVAIIFLISLCCCVKAQKSIFVRVYDLSGKKIDKGRIFDVTDTLLQLERKSTPVNISLRNIGTIKTRHSAANNLLIGSVVGATSLAIVGAASAEPDATILGYTAGEGATTGALIGATFGTLIGGLTIFLKKSEIFVINGDQAKWKVFQSIVNKKPGDK